MTKFAFAILDREGRPLEMEKVEILKEGAKTVTLVRHGGAAFGGRKVLPIELVNFSEEEALKRYYSSLLRRRDKLKHDLAVCEIREHEVASWLRK